MKGRANLLYVVLTLILLNAFANAQTPAAQDDEDIQSWNDIQLTVPLSKQFDFITSVTMRFGKNITRLTEAKYSIGFSWKLPHALSITPFYTYNDELNSAGRFRVEHRLSLRAAYKFPFKSFGLTHRSLFEYRMRPPVNTWRYRPSLTFDKEMPEKFIPKAKFYVTDEAFYDSARSKFSRNKFTVGITKTLSKILALDLYYLRRNDGFSHPANFNVIGTTWKIKL